MTTPALFRNARRFTRYLANSASYNPYTLALPSNFHAKLDRSTRYIGPARQQTGSIRPNLTYLRYRDCYDVSYPAVFDSALQITDTMGFLPSRNIRDRPNTPISNSWCCSTYSRFASNSSRKTTVNAASE